MKKSSRLAGIDLFRGIAVYAVIILHSDEGVLNLPTHWKQIINFAGFAVPFFLATSFYLTINGLYINSSFYSLSSRLIRLLIPYTFWSGLYLLYKATKYIINNEFYQLNSLFQDRISLIFFGGAAFHLYFLPLLLSGTLLVKLPEYLIKKQVTLKVIFLLCILSFVIYEFMLSSGNSFQIGSTNMAFQPLLNNIFPDGKQNTLLRLIFVEIAWMLRCLPYIFTAMLLNHPLIRRFFKPNPYSQLILGLTFLLLNLFNFNHVCVSIYEVVRGYTTLILAISISGYLKTNSLIENLGLCSFGIYLIHLLFVEVFQMIENKLYHNYLTQVSTLALLGISIITFFISWIVVFLLMKNKTISKLMFGI
jgi:surface polysaccharide O-acyltransferase-like enzyme